MNYKIFTDGASRGNPGPSCAGGVIYLLDEVIYELSVPLGITTNNIAEYTALKLTLEKAIELHIDSADVFMDSKLVVEQMNKRWKIKNERLKELNQEIQNLLPNFTHITFNFVYRHLNTHADKLANQF